MIIIGVVSDILPFPLSSKMEPLERDEQKSKFSFSWKHLLISSCLWIAFLLCSMAYSTMNPFFPQEVITVIYLAVAVTIKKMLQAVGKGTPSSLMGLIIGIAPLTVVITSPIFGYIVSFM